jgi:GNAT superfamily N-acetyltransferase
VLTVISNPPKLCSLGDIAAFESLALQVGEVDPHVLHLRIARAERLAFALLDRELVGVGAIKSPDSVYRKSVFRKSGAGHADTAFDLELVWVNVRAEYRGRGISGRLVQELMANVRSRYVFATSRTDNPAMHATLKRFGFVRDGTPYVSHMRRARLELFVRVAMKPGVKRTKKVQRFKIRLLLPVRAVRASTVVVRLIFRGYMKDAHGHVQFFDSREAARAEAAKARLAGLFYRVVDAGESPPGKHKRKARSSVWTIQGGGFETNRRRH